MINMEMNVFIAHVRLSKTHQNQHTTLFPFLFPFVLDFFVLLKNKTK